MEKAHKLFILTNARTLCEFKISSYRCILKDTNTELNTEIADNLAELILTASHELTIVNKLIEKVESQLV